MKRLPNIHPGEALLAEFLEPMGVSQNALARAAGVPPRFWRRCVHRSRRRVSCCFLQPDARCLACSQHWCILVSMMRGSRVAAMTHSPKATFGVPDPARLPLTSS
jgi:hypothetical protein